MINTFNDYSSNQFEKTLHLLAEKKASDQIYAYQSEPGKSQEFVIKKNCQSNQGVSLSSSLETKIDKVADKIEEFLIASKNHIMMGDIPELDAIKNNLLSSGLNNKHSCVIYLNDLLGSLKNQQIHLYPGFLNEPDQSELDKLGEDVKRQNRFFQNLNIKVNKLAKKAGLEKIPKVLVLFKDDLRYRECATNCSKENPIIYIGRDIFHKRSLPMFKNSIMHEFGHIQNEKSRLYSLLSSSKLPKITNFVAKIVWVCFAVFSYTSPLRLVLGSGLIAFLVLQLDNLYGLMALKGHRNEEYKADEFSVKKIGKKGYIEFFESLKKQELISHLLTLDFETIEANLANGILTYKEPSNDKIWHSTHPSHTQRIEKIKSLKIN